MSHTCGDRALILLVLHVLAIPGCRKIVFYGTLLATEYRLRSAVLLSESPLVHGVMDSWQSAFVVFVPPTRNSTELILMSGVFIFTS